MLKKILTIIKILGLVVVSILVAMTVIQRLFPQADGLLGFKTFVIVSPSMKPSLQVGDVILTKTIEAKNIKVSDVITYEGESAEFKGKFITHKVNQIATEEGDLIFYTKGTNNILVDPVAVYPDQIQGKVIYKFFVLSLISKIIRNTFGFIVFIILPLSILFIFEIMDIRKELRERRKQEWKRKEKKRSQPLF